jgi:hypothetical protein
MNPIHSRCNQKVLSALTNKCYVMFQNFESGITAHWLINFNCRMLSDVTILGALVVEGYKMRRLAHHVCPSVCMQYHRSGTTARVSSEFFVDDRRLAFCHVYNIRLDPSIEAVISEIHDLSILFFLNSSTIFSAPSCLLFTFSLQTQISWKSFVQIQSVSCIVFLRVCLPIIHIQTLRLGSDTMFNKRLAAVLMFLPKFLLIHPFNLLYFAAISCKSCSTPHSLPN